MSRRVALAAVMMLCLLLSACAPLPLTQPPPESMMRDSWVYIKDGEVYSRHISTWDLQGLKVINYILQEDNGIRRCGEVKDGGGTLCEFPYEQFAPALEAVIARAKADRFGLPESDDRLSICYYACDTSTTNANIAMWQPGDRTFSLIYRGYYVYSLKKGTLTQGDGVEIGIEELGRFRVTQHLPTLPNEDLPTSGEYVYILITD